MKKNENTQAIKLSEPLYIGIDLASDQPSQTISFIWCPRCKTQTNFHSIFQETMDKPPGTLLTCSKYGTELLFSLEVEWRLNEKRYNNEVIVTAKLEAQ